MDNIYIIGIVVFGILAIYLGIKHFNTQVKLDGEVIEKGTDKVIEIVEAVVGVLNLDTKTEKTIQDILNVANESSKFAVKLLSDTEDRTKVSLSAIEKILNTIKVSPTESEQKLINIVVEESVKHSDRNKQK